MQKQLTLTNVSNTLKSDTQLLLGHVARSDCATVVFLWFSQVIVNGEHGVCFVFSSSRVPASAAEVVLETMNMRACDCSVVTNVGIEACITV